VVTARYKIALSDDGQWSSISYPDEMFFVSTLDNNKPFQRLSDGLKVT